MSTVYFILRAENVTFVKAKHFQTPLFLHFCSRWIEKLLHIMLTVSGWQVFHAVKCNSAPLNHDFTHSNLSINSHILTEIDCLKRWTHLCFCNCKKWTVYLWNECNIIKRDFHIKLDIDILSLVNNVLISWMPADNLSDYKWKWKYWLLLELKLASWKYGSTAGLHLANKSMSWYADFVQEKND